MGGSCKDRWLLLKLSVVRAKDEGLTDDDRDEKTKSVEPNVANKNTIESETIINNFVFNRSEYCLY
jgi:hypothetical protein